MRGEIDPTRDLEGELRAMAGLLTRLEARCAALELQKRAAERGRRPWGVAVALLLLVGLLAGAPIAVTAEGEPTTEERLAAVEAKLQYVTVEGTEMYITGANLNIRNGLGATNGRPGEPVYAGPPIVNGLGNLVIGYDESRGNNGPDDRSGSHNVIIGAQNNRSSIAGLVLGEVNEIGGVSALAIGGYRNRALGNYSAVVSGTDNQATGLFAVVFGGSLNSGTGSYSSVIGGGRNTAAGYSSSMLGGNSNSAPGDYSSVSGGNSNGAFGSFSSISGGQNNSAVGTYSTVGGGRSNHANGESSSISGGYVNYATGFTSSVSGGNNNVASGGSSSVSGGGSRSVSGAYNWRGGSFFSSY